MLNFLSSYLKLDLNYFIEKGSWLTLSYIISSITGLILVYLYANFLDKSLYGQFVFDLSLLSFIGIFSLIGMGQALTYALSEGFYGNYKRAVFVTLKISLIGTLLFLGYFTKDLFFGFTNYTILLLALVFPIYAISTYYQSLLISKKQFKKLAIINITVSLSTLFFTAAAIFIKPNVFYLVAASTLPPIIVNTFFTLKYLRQLNPLRSNKSNIDLGFHLSILHSLQLLTRSLDKVIMGFLVPLHQLAIYSFALIIPDQVNSLTKFLIPMVIPKISDLTEKDIKKSILQKFFLAQLMLLTLIFGFIIISPILFKIFFPKFIDSLYLAQIYSFSLISLPVNLLSLSFQKLKLNQPLYIQEVLYCGSMIVLLLILVPHFSIMGAIYAQVLSKVLYTITSVGLFYFIVVKKLNLSKI